MKCCFMKAIPFIFILVLHCLGLGARQFDTLHIYFPLNMNQVTEESAKYIDSLIGNKVLEHGKKISLLGYGDYLGSEDYNNNLSYSRAKNVQDYLVASGFSKQDVVLCKGKGKINKAPTNGKYGILTDRKVDIIIDSKIDTPAEAKFTYYILRLHDSEAFILQDIRFYRGSLTMDPASVPGIKMLYRFLAKYSTMTIQLEGHVCCLGPLEGRDEPYDESTLSQKRAEVLRDSLVLYGINKERIKCLGLGNNNPIRDPETNLEDEVRSRRVEMRVLSR